MLLLASSKDVVRRLEYLIWYGGIIFRFKPIIEKLNSLEWLLSLCVNRHLMVTVHFRYCFQHIVRWLRASIGSAYIVAMLPWYMLAQRLPAHR